MSILTDVRQSGHVSFEELYEGYHQAMARRAKCFLVRDPDLVEDVLQEAWINAWKALPQTPEPGYAWLYRIVTNCAINALRKKYRYYPNRGGRPLPLPLSLDAPVDTDNAMSLGDVIEDVRHPDPAESNRVDMEAAWAQLSPEEQRILALRVEGLRLRDIMLLLKMSYRMTWERARSAQASFRRAYQEVA